MATANQAIESNANSLAMTNKERRAQQDYTAWLEEQEDAEVSFIRVETLNRGRAYLNNHEEAY